MVLIDDILQAAKDSGRRLGKGAGFENGLVTGEAANNQRPGGDPVVDKTWSGVVGFWGLRGASLSSSSGRFIRRS